MHGLNSKLMYVTVTCTLLHFVGMSSKLKGSSIRKVEEVWLVVAGVGCVGGVEGGRGE